jgi:hypothetical protein
VAQGAGENGHAADAATGAPEARTGLGGLCLEETAGGGSLLLSFRHGLGHKVLANVERELGGIDLAFGPNAGAPQLLRLHSSIVMCH